ncbi:MAG TPA: T9SS type A sorting domain-containing protein [Saprospiraceae bacterium]|nr:T9SS type A sorting domain-containing protein [Saprospiraceae bacterium]HPI06991.1 T9SS type A sorting domain-containing protein [Saprospiraceae bacterium]
MKRQYIFPAFLLFYGSLFSQTIPVHSCAYHWCSGQGIEQANFESTVSPDDQSPATYDVTQTSGDNGCISLDLPAGTSASEIVRITPSKNNNPLNGLTTYQFFLVAQRINRHIDGTEPFTEIWQWFAADADLDGAVTENDITTLRNWLLGITFPDNAWRFVPKSFVFTDPSNPLQSFPPEFIRQSVGELGASEDFWGIQLGHVLTGTACAVTGTSAPATFTTTEAWPNPTSGHFTVQVELRQSVELRGEIFDGTGRRVAVQPAQNYAAGTATFEFQAPGAAGVYFWKITDGEGRYQVGKIEKD